MPRELTGLAPVYVGCAGWSVPTVHASDFPAQGTHLERYAARFPAVEINSSFYNPHRPATYARWAASTPPAFRFSVKLPKQITHELRLREVSGPLKRFLEEIAFLGVKLGPLLVQLPPSLSFDDQVAGEFFEQMRMYHSGEIACEPRHPSWFATESERLFIEHQIARVAADPAVVLDAAEPGGWSGLVYYRLHGSPTMYYSAYSDAFLNDLTITLRDHARLERSVWCIFDNTAAFAASVNARYVLNTLSVA